MEVDTPTPTPTPTPIQNNELIQLEQQHSDLVQTEKQNNEQISVEQQSNEPIEQQKNEPLTVELPNNEQVPNEQKKNEPVPVEQPNNDQVPNEQQKNEPVEQPNNEQVPNEQQMNEPVPVDQLNNEQVPNEQQKNEPVEKPNNEQVPNKQQKNEPVEKPNNEQVPNEQQKNEPVEQPNNEEVPNEQQMNEPVEQPNNEQVPNEQQMNEPDPVEQQTNKPDPIEPEKCELVPVEQQNDEQVPIEQQNNEQVQVEQQKKEMVIVEQQNSELVPMERQSNEQVPMEQQNNEQVPIEQKNNEQVPVEQPIDEQVPSEKQSNEPVPVEQPMDEQVPIEKQSNEPVPMEQQNNEQVPIEKQINEPVPMEHQNNEQVPIEKKRNEPVPVEQPNDEQVPIEKQSNEPVQVEQPNNEQVPIEQQNNEQAPIEQTDNEQLPVEQQNNEQLPIEQQNNEPVPMEQENNEQVTVEQQKNELLPVEQQSNESLPMEQHNNDIVPMVQQNNELVPMEEWSNEQIPAEKQNNEQVKVEEQQNNEAVPMVQENNEQVPVEQHKNELLPVEQQSSELLPTEQQNNELVLMEEQSNEQIPVEQRFNELVPVEQQNAELVYMEKLLPNNEPQPKRRKKSSIVWEHFTIEHVGAGCRRAYCKQCKQSFAYSTGSKVAGTSHLKRHIAKGACPLLLRQQNFQSTPLSAPSKMGAYSDTPKRRFRTPQTPYFSFNPDHCRQEISKMILMHDYPLHMVEHSGFVAFARSLQPRFDMVSFNTVQGDCVETYLREKQTLQKMIEAIPGRICLTLDMWSSSRTVGYVVLTGQFIDSDWKLQSKILNVIMEPYPESNTAFSHAVSACLSDWSLEGKLFSLTINQPLSDASVDNLRVLLSVKNPLVLSGHLLIGNCLARTLSTIAQDALSSVSATVKKIRDNVKYLKTSESLEDKFLQLKQQLQVPSSKVLALDDQTRWNTTYDMLVAAAELKEVFSCLDTSDSDFKNVPSMEDWKQVETLCAYLNPLFDTANILASPSVPTTNTFFHEAWKIQLELSRAAANEDPFISNLTKAMQEKFDNYWKSCCFILAIAVVMDPRFKMKLVEFSFRKIYGEEKAPAYVKVVDEGIHELFNEYTSLPSDQMQVDKTNNGEHKPEDDNEVGLLDFDMYMKETNSQHPKSELDQYLEESLLPRVHEFDVVGWWRLNKEKYPTLSKMARDILSVPVCSVTPDSVFDTVKKEMDPYRCSLRPETIEALICTKDWIQIQRHSEDDSKAVVKMEVPI